jgi:2-methoxy-6-polyprenyl-1,4-benzoquinol methylase
MTARLSIRALQRVAVQTQRSTTVRVPSTFFLSRNASSTTTSSTADEEGPSNRKTHFGYETVTEEEKTERVAGVFTSVAESYDKMNDLMSFGWHRVWK